MIRELDTVVLRRDVDDHNLRQGDIGAVVHCYQDNNTFEVEFVKGTGETVALLTLTHNDIRLMDQDEILHVRGLAAA